MKKLATKLQAKPVLCFAILFLMYCIVGTMDYADATRDAGKPAAESNQ